MISLSSEEVKSLKKVINFILDTEGDSYEEHIKEGGKEGNHVMYHAIMMNHILNLKGELPQIKLTEDTSLDKFNKGGE